MSVSLHPVTDLASLLDLEMVKPDAYLGVSPQIGWDRIYGGQVVAQALRAAGLTVAEGFRPHSLHAYFVRAGDEKAPVLFEVERVRDGRSFATRQVVASQAGGVILNLITSFQLPEQGPDEQRVAMPAGIDPPADLAPAGTDLFFEHRIVTWTRDGAPRQLTWMRVPQPLGEDPMLHACALAYLSDEDLLGVALLAHPLGGSWERMMAASVDHALWFHRPARADEWLLFDLTGSGVANARGLGIARIFRADGTHVATVAQEGLGRERRGAAPRT
jgi:acyl-CoA thioesterase-2